MNVNVSAETTLAKARTTKVLSSGQGGGDSSIVWRWGKEIELMLSANTFVFDFLIEIAAAQLILILARHRLTSVSLLGILQSR